MADAGRSEVGHVAVPPAIPKRFEMPPVDAS